MRKPMNGFICALVAASAFAAAAAAENEDAQVERIINRALGLMAQVGDITVESDVFSIQKRLADGGESSYRCRYMESLRDSNLHWAEAACSSGAVHLTWSDGKVKRSYGYDILAKFNPQAQDPAEGKIQEQVLLEGNYSAFGEHKFHALSPLGPAAGPVYRALRDSAPAEGVIAQRKYLGRQQFRGELCDVIETSVRLQEDQQWKRTLAIYPGAPPTREVQSFKIYLRVSDGRPLRAQERGWGATQVKDEWIFNLEENTGWDYRYRPAPPADDLSLARFNAAVVGMTGGVVHGKLPEVVRVSDDEWQGRPMPDLSLATLDGNPVRLAEFKDKVLVVETWFIGCTYCKQAFPYYEKMRRQLKDKGVEFATLNVGESKTNSVDQIRAWMKKSRETSGFLWLVPAEPVKDIWQKLNSGGGAPTFFIIGTDGTIAASYSGFTYGEGGEDPRLADALKKAGVNL